MLNKNFQEFVGLLAAQKVKYLIVGGYAVGFHGFPRYTGDIDIFVDLSASNAKKLVKVFEAFGFPDSTTVQDFLTPDINIAIGEPPQRIHVLTSIDAVTFSEAHAEREYFKMGKLKIPFIGIHPLIKNKEAAGRDQDALDVKRLRELLRKKK